MPYTTNLRDGAKIYFEDDGGEAPAVVFHGGILDTVELVRGSPIARGVPREFRHIYVDHRGLGRSDKPHEAPPMPCPSALVTPWRCWTRWALAGRTSSVRHGEGGWALGSENTAGARSVARDRRPTAVRHESRWTCRSRCV